MARACKRKQAGISTASERVQSGGGAHGIGDGPRQKQMVLLTNLLPVGVSTNLALAEPGQHLIVPHEKHVNMHSAQGLSITGCTFLPSKSCNARRDGESS